MRARRHGYRFSDPKRAWQPATKNVAKDIAKLERSVGRIPAAIRLFWERVGSVDLSGTHPSWRRSGCIKLPGTVEPVWMTELLCVYSVKDLLYLAADPCRQSKRPIAAHDP